MSTLMTKPAAKRVRRRPAGKKLTLKEEILSLVGTRMPPPAKSTTADLLRSLRDGSFDRAAAKCDWATVETVVKDRRSSAALRAAQG